MGLELSTFSLGSQAVRSIALAVFSGAIPAASECSHKWETACLYPLTFSNAPNGMRVASGGE